MRFPIFPILLVMLSTGLISSYTAAGQLGQKSDIAGSLTIKVDAGTVKNLISNSTGSQGQVKIGGVTRSRVTGNVYLDKIKVGEVTNILKNAHNSTAKVKIGVIENSTVKHAKIKVNVKKVKNQVTGTNNHGLIGVGIIKDSVVTGQVNMTIKTSTLSNRIKGGSNNKASINIGSIDSDEDEDDDNSGGNADRLRYSMGVPDTGYPPIAAIGNGKPSQWYNKDGSVKKANFNRDMTGVKSTGAGKQDLIYAAKSNTKRCHLDIATGKETGCCSDGNSLCKANNLAPNAGRIEVLPPDEKVKVKDNRARFRVLPPDAYDRDIGRLRLNEYCNHQSNKKIKNTVCDPNNKRQVAEWLEKFAKYLEDPDGWIKINCSSNTCASISGVFLVFLEIGVAGKGQAAKQANNSIKKINKAQKKLGQARKKSTKRKKNAKQKKKNGNSKNSNKPQHGFFIIDTKNGKSVAFVGISGQPLKKGKSTQAEKLAEKWNKQYDIDDGTPNTSKSGKKRYRVKVVKNIPGSKPTKKSKRGGVAARSKALVWKNKRAYALKAKGQIDPNKQPLRKLKVPGVGNGNNKDSTLPQHGYYIIDTWKKGPDGRALIAKVGISGSPLNKNGSPRANSQKKAWNKQHDIYTGDPNTTKRGKKRYRVVLIRDVPGKDGGENARRKVLKWERDSTRGLRSIGHLDPDRHHYP